MVTKRLKESEVEFIIIAWLLILYAISIVMVAIGMNKYIEFICSKSNEIAFLMFFRPIILIITVILDVVIFIFLVYYIFKALSIKKFFGLILVSILYILSTIINFILFSLNTI